ncbi:MAG: DUF192 domain-containing protein [Pseudomonadota bacterium]|jgi:uncharacterized membrane protein (UPF0127 family)
MNIRTNPDSALRRPALAHALAWAYALALTLAHAWARARKRWLGSGLGLALALAGTLSATAHAGQPQLDLPRVHLHVGPHQVSVQVASTHAQRQTGLMWRRAMASDDGMLFVFERAGIQCFWMQNTFLPLTAAFVADDGRIVNLADMEPLSTRSHCSSEPVRFVLELHQGWFAQRGIGPGMKLRGGPFAGQAALGLGAGR